MATSVEVVIAVLFAVAGVRSLWKWARRPFETVDPLDHVLYAMFVTGRVGLWFAFAGFFAIYASVDASGGSLAEYRWYLLVPLVLGAMQLVGGVTLGRRGPTDDPEPQADEDA